MRMPANTEVAKRFGNLIAKSDYAAARSLLTKEARSIQSPDDFKEAIEGMTTYAPGPIQEVEVMSDFILEDWPDSSAFNACRNKQVMSSTSCNVNSW